MPGVGDNFFTVSMTKSGGGAGTHDVLVRVHEHLKAILLAFPEDSDSVVHEVIVIDPTGGHGQRLNVMDYGNHINTYGPSCSNASQVTG